MSLLLIVYKTGSVHSVRLVAQIHLCEISATKRTQNKSCVSYPEFKTQCNIIIYSSLKKQNKKKTKKNSQQFHVVEQYTSLEWWWLIQSSTLTNTSTNGWINNTHHFLKIIVCLFWKRTLIYDNHQTWLNYLRKYQLSKIILPLRLMCQFTNCEMFRTAKATQMKSN